MRDEKAYEYGFQGQMRTDALAGSGNHYTAPNWEYSPRLGRRWNTDPVVYPWQSSYATFNNNPIYFKDPSGFQGIAFNGGGGDKKKGGGSTTSPQEPQSPPPGWKPNIREVNVYADAPKQSFFSRLWNGIKNVVVSYLRGLEIIYKATRGNEEEGYTTLTGESAKHTNQAWSNDGLPEHHTDVSLIQAVNPNAGSWQSKVDLPDDAQTVVDAYNMTSEEYGPALDKPDDKSINEKAEENANNYHKKFKKVVSPDVVLYKTINTNTGKKYYRKEEDEGSKHTIIDESTYNNYDLTEEEIK